MSSTQFQNSILKTELPLKNSASFQKFRIKQIWHNFITSGIKATKDERLQRQTQFINSFTLVGVLTAIGMAAIHFWTGYVSWASFELAIGAIMLFIILLLRLTRKVAMVASFSLLTIILLFLILFYTGGAGDAGILWFAIFPILAFFLKKKREGLIWTAVFTACLLVTLHLGCLGFINPVSYSSAIIIQLLTSLWTVSFLAYFYARVNEKSEKLIKERSEDLQKTNTQLKTQIREREEAERELAQGVKKLENTKKAMVNLLEDSRELEEELKGEKDRVQQIISSMGEGLLVVGKDYKIVLMNPKSEKLLETPINKAVGQPWSDIVTAYIDGTEIPFNERTSILVLRTGKTIITRIEDNHYYKIKSGKMFPVASITAPLKRNGKTIAAVKVFRDATQEKKSKEIIEKKVKERTRELEKAKDKISEGWMQLQQEKARLAASIHSLSIGFMIIDLHYQTVMINPAIKEILEPISDKRTFKTITERLKEAIDLKNLYEQCFREKKPVKARGVEFENKSLQISLTPVILEEDRQEVIGAVVLIEDVTETRVLERSRDEFFALASHELRTPLTAIRGNTFLIQEYFADKIKDNPNLQEMISDIHDSSVRLIKIVNDFLDVSRLEQKKVHFKKEVFDLRPLLEEVIDEFKTIAFEKNLYLRLKKIKTSLPKVIADKERTRQVIINLIDNALKFTKKGGISIKIERGGKRIKVKVTDTGKGIPKQNQRLLFRKFQQAEERILTRDVTRGTGMGLYISKLLVEGMEGEIYLETSAAGKGSTFVFTLPLAKKNKTIVS